MATAAPGGRGLLRGVVVDTRGHPVPGAVVAVVGGPVPVPDVAALTGDDGGFAVAVPASGTYRVQARDGERVATVDLTAAPVAAAAGAAAASEPVRVALPDTPR